MTEDQSRSLAEVEALLARLGCDLVLVPEASGDAAWRAGFGTVRTRLEALGGPTAARLCARVDALVGAASAEDARAAFDALVADVSAWRDGTAAVPAEGSAPDGASGTGDDDLEMLRADPELASMFVAEALDHLGTIEASILKLESSPRDAQLLNDIFRPFHTIKGNAGALGVGRVQQLAHTVETLLDHCRSGRLTPGPHEIDAVLKAVDLLTTMIQDIGPRLGGGEGRDVWPASLVLMDAIQALSAAAASPGGEPRGTDPHQERPTQAPALPEEPRRRAEDQPGHHAVRVDTRKLDTLIDMVGELVVAQSILYGHPAWQAALDERAARQLAQLRRITGDLQRTAMSMRMVPIRSTFQKMARLVRDLSKQAGKQVELVFSGGETELDRKVVEEITDPLMHMIRNSLDHGIERPEERMRAGKPPTGRVELTASHEAGNIAITVADDGRGLQLARILEKAVERGLVPEGASLTPQEIHQLIFKPGFSTAVEVTAISGRGVGMDVVRRNIESLRGRVDISSTPGEGTRFQIKLPLTLAIVEGLLVAAGDQRYVVPTFAVRESLRPAPGDVHHVQGAPRMIRVRDSLLPLVRLSDLFGIGASGLSPAEMTAVVIEDDGRRLALLVDRLLGKQEVVVKSLGSAFRHVRGVAGGAILGDGLVGLILDAGGVMDLTDERGPEYGGRPSPQRRAAA